MDAASYLKRHGWRGDGHSLDHTGRGIRKPLLVSKKVDVLGVGLNKHAAVSDQWWMRAYDSGLKDLGTGKRSALADVREKGMAYGGLYGRFVKGEGVAGTFDEEEESKSSRKRKREESQKPGNIDKRFKTSGEALHKTLNRDVRRFVHEAVQRRLIPNDDDKRLTKKGEVLDAVSKFGEVAVNEVFKNAGILNGDKDYSSKYSRGKLQRAVKRAAKEFLLGRMSADERRAVEQDGSHSKDKRKAKIEEQIPDEPVEVDKAAAKGEKALKKQGKKAKRSPEREEFGSNADEIKPSISSKGKLKTLPGVGVVDRCPTKAEKRSKKKQRPTEKENTTPEHTLREDEVVVGFIADSKGDAGLEGQTSSSDSLSVMDSGGKIRYTCKPNQAVPLDPAIWTGIKPKLLPEPVRKARSEYMSQKREAREERKVKKRHPSTNTSCNK